MAGLIIKTVAFLYKDEVWALRRVLGIGAELPFLSRERLAIRIPGEISRKKVSILQDADAVFISELRRRDLYEKMWQAFALLL